MAIKQQLDAVANQRTQFSFTSSLIEEAPQRFITTSQLDIPEVYGRDMDRNTILGYLVRGQQQTSQDIQSGICVVSIVGIGGVGKTTLAQLVFNHPEVKAHFDERIWVCVSDPFDPIRIFTGILEILQGESPNLHNLEALQRKIHTCITGKRLLIVLDDVWTENHQLWGQLKTTLSCGGAGSRILATTRKESVVKMMGTTFAHSLEELSREQSRALFHQIAFFQKSPEKVEELEVIGEKIADKCKGLPLAIKSLAILMGVKSSKEEWESVLNSEVWQLDEFERDISPALLLSYYDLPPAIKRCFSYCAVFPKDCVIEVDKLIKLWMAQNYLNSNVVRKEMEVVGKEYFEYLAARSFFQDFEKDDDDNIIRCKMHDIVHDFAQLLTKNECCIIPAFDMPGGIGFGEEERMKTSFQRVRHATLIGLRKYPKFFSNYKMKNLHTLLHEFTVVSSIDGSLPKLFQHMTCLRALDLQQNLSIIELPKELGKLMHLKYLNLSYCYSLREFPETICDLYNLQTLNIRECIALVELPKAVDKLVSLRHLQNFLTIALEGLPKEISRLKSLHTLEKFIVSNDSDNECQIGDLKDLNNLRGKLEIRGLRKVKDAGEAQEAELKNKVHLQHLTLEFGEKEGIKDVAEALQPHPNLKSLAIWSYGEREWHGWMMRSLLTQLRNLELSHCNGCPYLPPLGELPVLEKLEIKDMKSVKHIGGEFLGSSTTTAIFPKLKKLSFQNMKEWEKWEVEEEGRSIMSCLSFLSIRGCPKLEELPEHVLERTPLEELVITDSDILLQRYQQDMGEE